MMQAHHVYQEIIALLNEWLVIENTLTQLADNYMTNNYFEGYRQTVAVLKQLQDCSNELSELLPASMLVELMESREDETSN